MALPELFKEAFTVNFFFSVRVPARQSTSLSMNFTNSVFFPQSLKTQKESFLESNEHMKIRYTILWSPVSTPNPLTLISTSIRLSTTLQIVVLLELFPEDQLPDIDKSIY